MASLGRKCNIELSKGCAPAGILPALQERVRVLVTRATGVIGTAAIQELLNRGHAVRLLTPNGESDVQQWPGIEAFRGAVDDSLDGAASGCDAVLHIAESGGPPIPHNLVREAVAASVSRFVVVCTGDKDAGERLLKDSNLLWTIVRAPNVFGPGDDFISSILKMVRSLPAVPVIDDGEHPFRPVWHEDLAKALANIIELDDLPKTMLEVGGAETSSINDIIDRVARTTKRDPVRIPVPSALARAVRGVAEKVQPSSAPADALATFGVKPTQLDHALRKLAQSLPEQFPDEGIGALRHKCFWADIVGSPMRAASLLSYVREQFDEIMPIEVGTESHSATKIETGNSITMHMPLRGSVQVRVEYSEPARFLLITTEGHPLAGAVCFSVAENGKWLTFSIDVYARSANIFDFVALNTIGGPVQDAHWRRVVQKVIDLSRGAAPEGVRSHAAKLSEAEADAVDKGLRSAVYARRREESTRESALAATR